MKLLFAISTIISFSYLQQMCYTGNVTLSNNVDAGSSLVNFHHSQRMENLKADHAISSGEIFLTSLRYLQEVASNGSAKGIISNEIEFLKLALNKFIQKIVHNLHELYENIPDSPKRDVDLVESVVKKINIVLDTYKTVILLKEETYPVDKATIENLKENYDKSIKLNANIIGQILLDKEYMYYLKSDFLTSSMNIATICHMKMSQWQLMYNIFGILNFVYQLTYHTGEMIFSLEGQNVDSENHEVDREELFEDIRKGERDYEVIYKGIVEKASSEFWTCDLSKDGDMEVKNIKLFSNYILSERSVSTKTHYCPSDNIRCPNIKELKSCGNAPVPFCQATRLCPGKLSNCQQFAYSRLKDDRYWRHSGIAWTCIPKDKSQFARYKYIVDANKQDGGQSCENGNVMEVTGEAWYDDDNEKVIYCDTCNCICEESLHYFSRQWALSDTSNNKVVVGGKLTVENDTIYVQIQEGTLSANGTIENDSVTWKPIDRSPSALSRREPVTWDGFRELALTKVVLPGDQIVTGLRLIPLTSKRIGLVVYSTRFIYKTGELQPTTKPSANFPAPGTNEYMLENHDKPNKGDRENLPRSNDDQWIKFTTTSLEKDGGQTTIPFIDVRQVSPIVPAPLSGVQLFLKGQDERGGILGLKLFVYNQEPIKELANTIPSDIDCPSQYHGRKKQMYETCTYSEECDSDKKLCCRIDDLGRKILKVCAYIRDVSACIKSNVQLMAVKQCDRHYCYRDEDCCPGSACDVPKKVCKLVARRIEDEVCEKTEDCELHLSCMEYDKCNKVSTCQSTTSRGLTHSIEDKHNRPCYNRTCTVNEDCCAESVCKKFTDGGRCRLLFNLDENELCENGEDCKKDHHCARTTKNERATCRKSFTVKQGAICTTSKECDMPNDYCCAVRSKLSALSVVLSGTQNAFNRTCERYLQNRRNECLGSLE